MRSLSVELKLAVLFLVVCVFAGSAAARFAGEVFERSIEDSAMSALKEAADSFAVQERSEIEKLSATLDALLANAELRQAFVRRDRARLQELAGPLFSTIRDRDRITHWYFIDPDRTVFLRVHRPELHGDVVDRVTLRRAVQTGDVGAGKELGQTAFALRAVRPWVHQGQVIGYVELAEEIDGFLEALKQRTGDDYGLLVKKRFLDERAWAKVLGPRSNTWNDRPDVVVVDTTTFTEGIIDFVGDVERLPDRGLALGEAIRGDRAFIRGIFPVRDAESRIVGGLFVLHDFTGPHDALRAARLQTALVLVGLAAGVTLLLVLAVRWLVFSRLARMRRALEAHAEVAALPPSRVVQLESEDELGRLEGLLHRILFPSRYGREPGGDAPGRAPDRKL